MARFDRYMLSQLMVLFGFFSLVLVAIYWINRAVKLFDRLIGDGQTALVFAEFTALTLPSVIRLVLPVAAFAATVYVTNRLTTESELTVMRATGFSPWRLARPVVYFGLIVALMLAVLTHLLVPASLEQLKLRESEISRNVTARLLTEGTFLHPSDGMTFYIREITPEGRMNDVFLSDRTSPDESVTYTAEAAYLVRQDSGPSLVMLNGLTQRLQNDTGRLVTTRFTDLTYDISSFIKPEDGDTPLLKHFASSEMLRAPGSIQQLTEVTRGVFTEELHSRFAQPLFAFMAALLGFAALTSGGHSRFGVWRHILFAIALIIFVKGLESVVTEPVLEDHRLWPLLYLPFGTGMLIALVMLARSAGHVPTRAWLRRRADAGAGGLR